jgi:sugar lactone lactonase YvrE
VIQVDPESGKLLGHIRIPAQNVTSVAFGGPQLDEMYVTTASIDCNEEQVEKYPGSGTVYHVTGVGVKGYPGQTVKL